MPTNLILTKLTVRNFKRFEDVALELGDTVVFIGPNNSGKGTALQALALWQVGLSKWLEKRGDSAPEKRPGVTINRRDLLTVPVPTANLLWHDLRTRDTLRTNGEQQTQNIRIEIVVEGVSQEGPWICGLEFDYANPESFYCRPLRLNGGEEPERMAVPRAAAGVKVAFLPPMSGLAANEIRLEPGTIQVRLGEGRTAEVLRNLCYQVAEQTPDRWQRLKAKIQQMFGVTLLDPKYIKERGEIEMAYLEPVKGAGRPVRLDLSSSGRGLQQTLLLLAYLENNPNSVLLLDEPDAHLEILRQRQIYQEVSDLARQQNSQVIIASHSEVLLNEAAGRDMLVAFLGTPHRIDDRGSQVLKSLKDIGFDQYYQAERTGWVLYLEGSTDLEILRALAVRLNHPAAEILATAFVRYVENKPKTAREHFYGLREAKPDLAGVALFDRLDERLESDNPLLELMWERREIENYLCQPETLIAFAQHLGEQGLGPLFDQTESDRRGRIMAELIHDLVPPVALANLDDPFWLETKVSDRFLNRVFDLYYQRLGSPQLMRKSNYHQLVAFINLEQLSDEVVVKLDRIVEVAKRAHPLI